MRVVVIAPKEVGLKLNCGREVEAPGLAEINLSRAPFSAGPPVSSQG